MVKVYSVKSAPKIKPNPEQSGDGKPRVSKRDSRAALEKAARLFYFKIDTRRSE
jgi:hypothetical protein